MEVVNLLLTRSCSREDLIAKTMNDIPKLSRAEAEAEVAKFMMDYEAVQMFIEFEKMREKDPTFEVPDPEKKDEGLFSFRNLVVAYIGYVAVTSGPTALQRYAAAQQAAGTWTGTGIPFVDDWLASHPLAVSSVESAVQMVTDVASVTS